jgi:hypothetical protein
LAGIPDLSLAGRSQMLEVLIVGSFSFPFAQHDVLGFL